jgi:hypothetical protein
MTQEYAFYKGEELLLIGTINEIAKARSVKRETINFYTTPTYTRRIAKRKHPRNYITVTRLDEDE